MQIDKRPFHSKDEWQGCLSPDECWWFELCAGDVRAQQTGRPTKRGGENIEQSLKLKRVCWFEEKTFANPLNKWGKYLSRRVTAGVKRVHDVSEQAAFGMLPWQGALLPRRDHFSQCPHPGKSNNQMWRSIVKWMLLHFDGTTRVLFITKWSMAHALAFNWNLITIACIPGSLHDIQVACQLIEIKMLPWLGLRLINIE